MHTDKWNSMNFFRSSIDTNPIVSEPKIHLPTSSGSHRFAGVPLLSRRAHPLRGWWSRRLRFHVEVSAPWSWIEVGGRNMAVDHRTGWKWDENHNQLNQLTNKMFVCWNSPIFRENLIFFGPICQGMWLSKRMWAKKPVAKPKRSWRRCLGISKTPYRCRFLGKKAGVTNIRQMIWG